MEGSVLEEAVSVAATHAEVFKRLYHSGYTGGFYGVAWYGNPPGFLNPHYHQSVVSAFNYSKDFAAFIKGLSEDKINVAAHSLGNLVVGAAVQDYDINKIDNYFALNAAVLLEAYGDVAIADGMLNVHPVIKVEKYRDSILEETTYKKDESITWLDYTGKSEDDGNAFDNVYGTHINLPSINWYTLFEDNDPRSGLTWKERLIKVVENTNMYNFYSSTENVLANYEGDNYVVDGTTANFGDKAFVKQEKYKGRSNIVVDIAGGPSPFAGWGSNLENENYTVVSEEVKQIKSGQERTVETRLKKPEELGDLDEDFIEDLKSKPFFLKTPEDLFDPETGYEYLNKSLAEIPELNDYYNSNKLDTPNVKVRDFLLAEAVPGSSWACGSNKNEVLGDYQNYDISTYEKTEEQDFYFMTYGEKLEWPRKIEDDDDNLTRAWWHSDYKNASYNNVYKFYNKISSLCE